MPRLGKTSDAVGRAGAMLSMTLYSRPLSMSGAKVRNAASEKGVSINVIMGHQVATEPGGAI